MSQHIQELTLLLNQGVEGDEEAFNQLFSIVYGELRKIARSHLRNERINHTLQATEIVHEAYPQLLKNMNWQNRAHFFAFAAKVMRNILIDYAKKRNAVKRGGDLVRVSFEKAEALPSGDQDLLALDEALKLLAEISPRQAQILELHFFGGLTMKQISEVLGFSEVTLFKEMKLAKVWLFKKLKSE